MSSYNNHPFYAKRERVSSNVSWTTAGSWQPPSPPMSPVDSRYPQPHAPRMRTVPLPMMTPTYYPMQLPSPTSTSSAHLPAHAHPALSTSTPLVWNVTDAIPALPEFAAPASSSETNAITILIPNFPRGIDITRPDRPVSVRALLGAIQSFLLEPLPQSDLDRADDRLKSKMMEACRARGGRHLRCVDWLCGKTRFVGIERDESYVRRAVGHNDGREIWVLKLRR